MGRNEGGSFVRRMRLGFIIVRIVFAFVGGGSSVPAGRRREAGGTAGECRGAGLGGVEGWQRDGGGRRWDV